MAVFMNVPANPGNPVMAEIVTECDVLEADGSTQKIVNVYHLAARAGNPGGQSQAGLGNAFTTLLNTVLPAVLSVGYTGGLASCRFIDDPTNLPTAVTGVGPGTVTGDRLPTLAAVSFDLVTSARGRCFRGRKHYGPIAESDTLLDELTAGAVTNWAAVAAIFGTGVPVQDGAGNSYDPCVLSRINSNLIGPGVYFTYSIVVGAGANPRIGTMRRRKEGVGS